MRAFPKGALKPGRRYGSLAVVEWSFAWAGRGIDFDSSSFDIGGSGKALSLATSVLDSPL
jgi:hypothetical protein